VRWKLLIITSLVAALVGAGGDIALAYWCRSWSNPLHTRPTFLTWAIIIPLVLVTLAGIFVYRHTARRRKLQATATVILSIILTLAALCAAQIFLQYFSSAHLAATVPAQLPRRRAA
jgi:Na+/H+-dicarboxylate symporter